MLEQSRALSEKELTRAKELTVRKDKQLIDATNKMKEQETQWADQEKKLHRRSVQVRGAASWVGYLAGRVATTRPPSRHTFPRERGRPPVIRCSPFLTRASLIVQTTQQGHQLAAEAESARAAYATAAKEAATRLAAAELAIDQLKTHLQSEIAALLGPAPHPAS